MSFDEAAAVCDGAVLARTCLTSTRVGRGRSCSLRRDRRDRLGRRPARQRHLAADVTAVSAAPHLDLVGPLGRAGHRLHGPSTSRATGTTTTSCGRRRQELVPPVPAAAPARRHLRLHRSRVPLAQPAADAAHPARSAGRVMVPIPRMHEGPRPVRPSTLVEAGAFRPADRPEVPCSTTSSRPTRFVETGQKVGDVVITRRPATARRQRVASPARVSRRPPVHAR